MRSETPEGFCSIPSATGGIARLACARLRELGKDVAGILAKLWRSRHFTSTARGKRRVDVM